MHNQKKDNDNLKTKNHQNCQKIEFYGSLTTKELKKKHSSRPVGRVEMGIQAERTLGTVVASGPGEVVDCRLGGPTFTCRQSGRSNRGAR